MWRSVHGALFVLMVSSPVSAKDMRWPNPQVPVPPLVHQFIVGECRNYQGTTHESLDNCILGERYGYRAVVMVLMEEETGERAAERYRACAKGIGDLGGRFHRNRAECISGSFDFHWRFEFSQETAIQPPARQGGTTDGGTRIAANPGAADQVPVSR